MPRGIGFPTELVTKDGAITVADREDGEVGIAVSARGEMTLEPAGVEEVMRVLSRYLEASRRR